MLAPIARHLRENGVDLRLGRPVERVEVTGADPCRFAIAGERFEHVVVASDVEASRRLLAASPELAAHDPGLLERLARIGGGQRYAVMRLWMECPSPTDLPVFVATERIGILDAVAFNDRYDPRCDAWARAHHGGVVELHSYAVPDAWDEQAVRRELVADLRRHLPCYTSASIVRAHLQLRSDFSAFHVGMADARPATQTAVAGLVLAGDWVKLPIPAMLMEAAFVSGRLAANAIARHHGCREAAVASFTAPWVARARPSRRLGPGE